MKELPSYVIFNGKEDWYYFDGKSSQTEEEIEAFLSEIASGKSTFATLLSRLL